MVAVLSGLLVQGSGVDLRAWWRYQQPRVHAAVYGGVILAVISGLVLAVILVNSFTIEGRSAGLRTSIYADALTIFAEQPVTGRGLFTFGRELSVLQSEPPQTPHSHAHNVVLHIAAELGLIGLAAGAVTLAFLGLAMWRTWTQAGERERPLIAGAITASVGILVHLMTDFTVMQMTIANSTLLMLVLATVPPEPQPVPRSQRVAYPLAVTALGAVLVISGAWSASIHARYHQALRQAVAEGTYYEGAERLQSVIDDDPALSLYRGQQAYLYGLAANEGSADALERAISGYEQFTEMEPQWSTAWANLAALYWQADRPQDAIDAMQQAVDAAPRAWQFAFTLGSYYEASGNEAAARDAYSLALEDPFEERAALYPAWNDTALRRSVATQVEPEGESLIVVSLNTVNETDEIDALWDASGLDDAETTQNYVLRLLLALRDDSAGNLPGLWDAWLEEAERLAVTPEDRAWVHLGRAALAASNGEPEFAEEETDRAAALIAPRLGRAEYPRLVNTANLQFLRDAIPRQTLPQVYFPTADPVLVRLLSEF
jgi:tetratricopeptide (TPR) repeat protein